MEYYHYFSKLLYFDYRGFIDNSKVESEKDLIETDFNNPKWLEVMKYIHRINMSYAKKFQINKRVN